MCILGTMKTTTQLTEKESKALEILKYGMDEENCGWLHEMLPQEKSTSGIISSLVKKGLITSFEDTDYGETCYWIEVTEKGQKI